MLSLVLWSLVVLALVAGIAFLILRTKKRSKPQLSIRNAIVVAKKALKNHKEWPKLYQLNQELHQFELIAYNSLKADQLDQPAIYRLRWPQLDLRYTVKPMSEELRLEVKEQEKHVTLLYLDGSLGSMALGTDIYDPEHFEMRHAGNLADQLRNILRERLCGGYGSHEAKKLDDPTEIAVNQAGDIKLSELPSRSA